MRAHYILAGLCVVAVGGAADAAIATEGSPCGAENCPVDTVASQANLNAAYWSSITSDSERDKMKATIATHTLSGKTDWSASALDYFNWRANADHYNYDPTGKAHNYSGPPQPQWGAMRQAAEEAIRVRLIDPGSAQFEWPFGFMQGSWKPILQRRISGWVTCGYVNAKNRLGGYVGRSAFVVVMDSGQVLFADMDSGNSGFVDIGCTKTTLPSPQSGMLETARVASPVGSLDVADELTKLAALRDKGIITQGEFGAQKAKLLGQ